MFKTIWELPVWTGKKILLTIRTLFKIAWFIMIPLTLSLVSKYMLFLCKEPIQAITVTVLVIVLYRWDKKCWLQKWEQAR